MITRHLLIVYLLMVGVPLILLVAVLRGGRTLEAPADVQGYWRLALSGSAAMDASCDPGLQDDTGFAVSISQSGSYLTATMFDLGRRLLRGRSEGADLWLESARLNGSDPDSDLLRLTGRVVETQGSKLIHGRLLILRRVDCPPVSFAARLQPVRERQTRPAEH